MCSDITDRTSRAANQNCGFKLQPCSPTSSSPLILTTRCHPFTIPSSTPNLAIAHRTVGGPYVPHWSRDIQLFGNSNAHHSLLDLLIVLKKFSPALARSSFGNCGDIKPQFHRSPPRQALLNTNSKALCPFSHIWKTLDLSKLPKCWARSVFDIAFAPCLALLPSLFYHLFPLATSSPSRYRSR